jgi:hypothetical protein
VLNRVKDGSRVIRLPLFLRTHYLRPHPKCCEWRKAIPGQETRSRFSSIFESPCKLFIKSAILGMKKPAQHLPKRVSELCSKTLFSCIFYAPAS